uniref:F-box domain-containing protein n=1 Tax=Leersia perrieri TaxID=77586 RepID=A0A0D9VJB8_9ORYZ
MTGRRDAGGTAADVVEDLWTQLPPELLPLVCKKLPDSADFVRFRTVCRAWRDAVPLSDSPPQLPWAIERRASAFQARAHFRFYSPSSGRTYSVRGYGGRSSLVVGGACQEHLVTTLDLSRTALYNPLTGDRLALNPVPFPMWRHGVVHVVAEGRGEERSFLVVNTSNKTRHFGYCRSGDTKWNMVDGREDMVNHAYHRGRFYVSTESLETLVIDASTGAVESVLPAPPPTSSPGVIAAVCGKDYLVESGGKLIRAIVLPRDGMAAASPEDYFIDMYQLEEAHNGKSAAWAKVQSIGDRVLFVDKHGHGFSLEPNDAAELRRDCVYFMHERRTWLDAGEYRFLCRYSMEDGVVDRVVSLPDTFGDTWVVPGLCPSE